MRPIEWTPAMLELAAAMRTEKKGYRAVAKALGISHGATRGKLNPHHRENCRLIANRKKHK